MKGIKVVVCLLWLSLSIAYSQSYTFEAFWETKKGNSHEVVSLGVKESEFQKAFDIFTKEGLELFLADGYDMGGEAYINFIFRTASGKKWIAKHGMTSQQYQKSFDHYVKKGNYRLGWVDSYRRGNSIRYIAIFTQKSGGGQRAYHGLTPEQHQNRFNIWTADGWSPVNVSVVSIDGKRYYTAFYEQQQGSFVLKSFLTRDEFDKINGQQKQKGRNLAYMNAYTHDHNLLPRFVAVWRSGISSGNYLPNVWGPSTTEEGGELGEKGYFTRFVTGYGVGNGHRFDAYWFKPERNVLQPNSIGKRLKNKDNL